MTTLTDKISALIESAASIASADISSFSRPIFKATGSKTGPLSRRMIDLYKFSKLLKGMKFVKALKVGTKSLGLKFSIDESLTKKDVVAAFKKLAGKYHSALLGFAVRSYSTGTITISTGGRFIEMSAPNVFGKHAAEKAQSLFVKLTENNAAAIKKRDAEEKLAAKSALKSGWPTDERMAGDFVADLFSRATSNAKILLIVKKASKYMADAITKVGAKPGKATWDIWPEDGDYVLNIQVPVVKGQKAVEEHLKSFSTIGVDKKGGYKLFMEDAVQGSKSIDLDTL